MPQNGLDRNDKIEELTDGGVDHQGQKPKGFWPDFLSGGSTARSHFRNCRHGFGDALRMGVGSQIRERDDSHAPVFFIHYWEPPDVITLNQ